MVSLLHKFPSSRTYFNFSTQKSTSYSNGTTAFDASNQENLNLNLNFRLSTKQEINKFIHIFNVPSSCSCLAAHSVHSAHSVQTVCDGGGGAAGTE